MDTLSLSDSPYKGLSEKMSLKLALDYVGKHPGRFLFPVAKGAKSPPLVKNNLVDASNDPEQIGNWAKKHPGANWGVAHRKSNLLVVDIDQKPGKEGEATFEELDLEYGFPATEENRTPSGGRHLLYEGKHVFALGKDGFGPDVDSPIYSLIPGCRLRNGTAYEAINDVPAAPAPVWFYEVLRRAKKKPRLADAAEAAVELDKPENIAWAIDFLKVDAEPAIEGKSGDLQTLKIAMGLRDRGISEATAFELMSEHYNPRCVPSWETDDLRRKVENGFAYASRSQVGGKTAEADFADEDTEVVDRIQTEGDPKTIKAEKKARENARKEAVLGGSQLTDFYCHGPSGTYIFEPTHDMWPVGSISNRFGSKGPRTLAKERAVEQATWAPGFPPLIEGRLLVGNAWTVRPGSMCFNFYRAPTIKGGDARKAGPWVAHGKTIYGHDWSHLEKWFAYRVQHPEVKINHCLVMGGDPGIGKDTLVAGLREAVGPMNFGECNPGNLFEEFDASFLQNVILRINEARDMGEGRFDRYQFYERTKTLMASPPETLSVQEKYLKRYSILNLVGLIITTNNKTNGLFLKGDDRRHYVAWSTVTESDLEPGYFNKLWHWYERENGFAHVAAYLHSLDLSDFDPKATPPKTAAFWEIVSTNTPLEETELAEALAIVGNGRTPDVVTIETILEASGRNHQLNEFYKWWSDRKNRRVIPGHLERAGYAQIRNPDAKSGLWRVGGERQMIYASKSLSPAERSRAVRLFVQDAAEPEDDDPELRAILFGAP